jgi:hypothetical protein
MQISARASFFGWNYAGLKVYDYGSDSLVILTIIAEGLVYGSSWVLLMLVRMSTCIYTHVGGCCSPAPMLTRLHLSENYTF